MNYVEEVLRLAKFNVELLEDMKVMAEDIVRYHVEIEQLKRKVSAFEKMSTLKQETTTSTRIT